MPGTITTSCRRTQAAVRNASMPFPDRLQRVRGQAGHAPLVPPVPLQGDRAIPYVGRAPAPAPCTWRPWSRRGDRSAGSASTDSMRGVVADVARSEQAEQADPRRRVAGRRGAHVAGVSLAASDERHRRRSVAAWTRRTGVRPRRRRLVRLEPRRTQPLRQVAVALAPVGRGQRRALDHRDVRPDVLAEQPRDRVPPAGPPAAGPCSRTGRAGSGGPLRPVGMVAAEVQPVRDLVERPVQASSAMIVRSAWW